MIELVRVLVVDDQPLMREGLRMMLESHPAIAVVGEAGDGGEAVEAARRDRPDVVLMDVEMPGEDGITATRRVVAADGAPRVLILTTFDREDYVFEALRAGASGFLLKTMPPADLVDAVLRAARGDVLLAPQVTRRLIERHVRRVGPGDAAAVALSGLTEREREVLGEIALGLSNDEIGVRLVVSTATVKTYVNRLFAKLRLRDRAQAVIFAYESGLVEPGERDAAG